MRVEQLRDVVTHDGPFATVRLDASRTTEDAAHQNELRWRDASARLAEMGADDATVATVGAAVLDSPPPVGDASRAVVAAHGELLVNEVLPGPPGPQVYRFSDLPYLMPLLSVSGPVSYVVVVADKAGGWLEGADRQGRPIERQVVRGSDHPVHQVGGGGRAHKSIEARAEETVHHNARELAAEVARTAGRLAADVLVVVGETQARSRLVAELPEQIRAAAVELDMDARAAERDRAALAQAVQRLVGETRAYRELDAVDRLRTGLAHGTATDGLAAVTEALRMGQVETLLVTDPVLAGRTVHVGDDPTQVDTRPADDTRERRADEALPAAAIATSADVLVVADGQAGDTPVADGVAALLRFTR